MKTCLAIASALAVALGSTPAPAQPSMESGSVLEAAERLRPGEFLWAPGVAPQGPVMLVVSLATQRAVLYRNGVPIAISTVSTGRPGHRTPTGIFTVLQRNVEHYSSLYSGAPMPYMQRLTWGGVALHGGHLPGYPASHGCIRLPHEFARLMYGVTRLGMTVVVTTEAAVPRLAPADRLIADSTDNRGRMIWRPDRSRSGPVSIVISARDQRMVVLRNGIRIGAAPARIEGRIARTSVYMLQSVVNDQRNWLRVALPGQSSSNEDLAGRIQVSDDVRRLVTSVLEAGATVVVTQDSLQRSSAARPVTVIQGDAGR
ncbi:MAG: L,D-transpeptidase [Sphingomonas sp.]